MIDFILAFPSSIIYVATAPYFWLSMGVTTGLAIFIGSIIYDGNLSDASKGLLSIGMYVFMLLQVNFTRVGSRFNPATSAIMPVEQAYAGVTTIFIISLFFLLGVFLGVFVSSKYHHSH